MRTVRCPIDGCEFAGVVGQNGTGWTCTSRETGLFGGFASPERAARKLLEVHARGSHRR